MTSGSEDGAPALAPKRPICCAGRGVRSGASTRRITSGRPQGSARAVAQHSSELPPAWAWSQDNSPWAPTISAGRRETSCGRPRLSGGPGVLVLSDAGQTARAMLETDRLSLHINVGTAAANAGWQEWEHNYGKGKAPQEGRPHPGDGPAALCQVLNSSPVRPAERGSLLQTNSLSFRGHCLNQNKRGFSRFALFFWAFSGLPIRDRMSLEFSMGSAIISAT